jgi:hypothetical protein
MDTNDQKILPFPNPIPEVSQHSDDYLELRFGDARSAMWSLLDATTRSLILTLDNLSQQEGDDFDRIATSIEESYHNQMLIFRYALDNVRSGRSTRTGGNRGR